MEVLVVSSIFFWRFKKKQWEFPTKKMGWAKSVWGTGPLHSKGRMAGEPLGGEGNVKVMGDGGILVQTVGAKHPLRGSFCFV